MATIMKRAKQQRSATSNDDVLSPSSPVAVDPYPASSLNALPTRSSDTEEEHDHRHDHEATTSASPIGSVSSSSSKKTKSRQRHRRVPALVRAMIFGAFCFMMVVVSSFISLHNAQTASTSSTSRLQRSKSSPYKLVQGSFSSLDGYYFNNIMVLPKPLGDHSVMFPLIDLDEDTGDSDFGGLEIFTFEEEGMRRAIYHDFSLDEGKNDRTKPEEDQVDAYYAFDDDKVRNPYQSRKSKKGKLCRRNRFHRRLPINCNTMYELDLRSIVERGDHKYLGSGAYREVYQIEKTGVDTIPFVYKTSGPKSKFKYSDYEFIRMDCLVLELFSSSPLIVDSYMYCGLDQIGEAMLQGNFESKAAPLGLRKKNIYLNNARHLDPKNSLTPEEKLQYALEMAEPLALLHGFYGGVLVHDDVQLPQYLLTPDGHLKLNDFNRAEFMLWNEKDQEYCKYRNNPGHGDWRAPEEYFDDPLNEQIDVFAYGNNLYTVLTGLSPFYTLDIHGARDMVKRGKKPFIDPRWRNNSFAEGKIVELIGRCYPFKAEDRITIFEAVKFLREAVAENERRLKGQVQR